MNRTASWRIVVDDPGAHGAKASRADARRPPFEGIA